jgi:hypothetical protein
MNEKGPCERYPTFRLFPQEEKDAGSNGPNNPPCKGKKDAKANKGNANEVVPNKQGPQQVCYKHPNDKLFPSEPNEKNRSVSLR